MDVILNIGLDSKIRASLTMREVTDALVFLGLVPTRVDKHQSDTEQTLVISVHTAELPVDVAPSQAIFRAAQVLGQEAIAAFIPARNVGRLIGPKAAAWGAFSPEFFLMHDGTRLSQHASLARAA